MDAKKDLTKRTEYVKISKNNALIEWVLVYLGEKEGFTGKITIEINVIDGDVKDFKTGLFRRELI